MTVAYKAEADGDYHLLLRPMDSQPDDAAARFGVEIVRPSFAPNTKDSLDINQARIEFEAFLAQKSLSNSGSNYTSIPPTQVTVKGVGFWDEVHGQAGMKNGFELHPVLSFQSNEGGAKTLALSAPNLVGLNPNNPGTLSPPEIQAQVKANIGIIYGIFGLAVFAGVALFWFGYRMHKSVDAMIAECLRDFHPQDKETLAAAADLLGEDQARTTELWTLHAQLTLSILVIVAITCLLLTGVIRPDAGLPILAGVGGFAIAKGSSVTRTTTQRSRPTSSGSAP